MIRPLLATAMIVLGAATALAQGEAVKSRQDVMKRSEDSATVLFRMTRGEVPFDRAKVDASYAQLEAAAKQFPTLFPANTAGDGAGNRASSKIWENGADFAARNERFAKAVGDGKAKSTNLDGLKTAFGAIDSACSDCHRNYRLSRRR